MLTKNSSNTILSGSLQVYDPGDIGFVTLSSIILWIMVPGCGFFYSGMSRSKNSLSLIMLSFWSIAIVSVQWYLIGYSLSFSPSANFFIGDFRNAFLIGVYRDPYADIKAIPELVFCLYQGVTATLAPSLVLGAVAERGRMLPAVLFILVWTTLVYDAIACWSLNPNGWSYQMGVLDFGGGGPVHVPSGAAALAYSILLGPRASTEENMRPHSMQSLLIGTTLIWFGSFGYNIGSSFASNMVAIMSCIVANLSGSAGAITWALLDYWVEKRLTAFGFCAGAVVGLVVILPGSGFVSPTAGVLFGIAASLASFFALKLKDRLKFDDTLDVFVMHGVSGVVGNVMTGIFAQKFYGGWEVRDGGWLDGNWIQVVYQLADTAAAFAWSFLVSFVTLYLFNKIPGLKLRVSPAVELEGVDETELGIKCYEFVDGLKVINPSIRDELSSNGNLEAESIVPPLNTNHTTNKNHWF